MTYCGPLTGPYRTALLAGWRGRCAELGLPAAPDFAPARALAEPVELREWAAHGLPGDAVSVENGLLLAKGGEAGAGARWPLMVDPHDQGVRWVKSLEAGNGLRAVAAASPALPQALEACVRAGLPLLVEACGEELEPALDAVLARAAHHHPKQGGAGCTLIRLGDAEVECAPGFRLYLATRLANPHLLPQACARVAVVNFASTRRALEDQLLADLLRRDRPDLEAARARLAAAIAADRRQLAALEARVLRLLGDAAGALLDDDALAAALGDARAAAAAAAARVREAEAAEAAVEAARGGYRGPPARAAALWFVVEALPGLCPMYRTGLAAFKDMFDRCAAAAPPPAPTNTTTCAVADGSGGGDAGRAALAARLAALTAAVTSHVCRRIARGLFAEHRAVFLFMAAAAVQRAAGALPPSEWDLLLLPRADGVGGASDGGDGQKSTAALEATAGQLLPAGAAAALAALDTAAAPAFRGAAAALSEAAAACPQPAALTALLEGPDAFAAAGAPELAALWQRGSPASAGGLTPFQRLLLVRAVREDALPAALAAYAALVLGPEAVSGDAAELRAASAIRGGGGGGRRTGAPLSSSSPAAASVSAPSVLEDALEAGPASTPIVLLLAQGADPAAELVRLAEARGGRGLGRGLHMVSLGKGQGPVAESLVRLAMRNGDWVCLQVSGERGLAREWRERMKETETLQRQGQGGGF